MSNNVNRKIGLLLVGGQSYSSGVLAGVFRYALANQWQVLYQPAEYANAATWRARHCDGYIVQMIGDATARFADLGKPCVDVSEMRPTTVPQVVCDNLAVGAAAADHLHTRPLAHFAYLCEPGRDFAVNRGIGFRQRLRTYGHSVHWLTTDAASQVTQWLGSLPKPLGLFCSNDTMAVTAVNACKQLHQAVGESVAVVGVDNNPDICSLTIPSLTSVDLDTDRIGYEAAAMLDQMLAGGAGRTIHVPPRGVVVRHSCEARSFHPDLIEAQRFIERCVDRPITVDDVAACVASSRRTLERHFHDSLGRSIRQCIVHVKIERAKELLASSDLTILAIAQRCGLTPVRLAIVFQSLVGMTPTAYRAQNRLT